MSLTGSRCLWTRAFPLWDFRTASCLLDFQPSLLATAKCFRPHCVCGHENHRNDHGGQPHFSFLITLGQSSPTCVQIQTPDTLSDIVFFLIEIIFKNLEFNKNPHFWFLSKKKKFGIPGLQAIFVGGAEEPGAWGGSAHTRVCSALGLLGPRRL